LVVRSGLHSITSSGGKAGAWSGAKLAIRKTPKEKFGTGSV
jgi:uncharacterized membrane protein YsdA (DUF1294 family)